MPKRTRSNYEDIDFFLQYKDKAKFDDPNTIAECFKFFANNQDTKLDIKDFERILKRLFCFNGNSYFISQAKIQRLFDFFKNETIDKIELDGFKKFWDKIVKRSLFARSALVIVDVQNDFISGTLSLKNCPSQHDGEETVPVINKLLDSSNFHAIAYTLDWHPANHCSFIENIGLRQLHSASPVNINTFDTVIFEDYPKVPQKLWPAHCVSDTDGAKFHDELKIINHETDEMKRHVFFAKKGMNPDIDSYSPFFNTHKLQETDLNRDLESEEISDVYICGLAYDVCVASTAFDALKLKYRVVIVEDACRGVDTECIKSEKKALINRGALVVDSKQVNDMIKCNDRRPEFLTSFLAQ